uniref:Uncharacterized protein n=1 Tax=Arundo donax TaxID=35708 RepID=A0A0A9HHQ0_ARUDO
MLPVFLASECPLRPCYCSTTVHATLLHCLQKQLHQNKLGRDYSYSAEVEAGMSRAKRGLIQHDIKINIHRSIQDICNFNLALYVECSYCFWIHSSYLEHHLWQLFLSVLVLLVQSSSRLILWNYLCTITYLQCCGI